MHGENQRTVPNEFLPWRLPFRPIVTYEKSTKLCINGVITRPFSQRCYVVRVYAL